MVFVNIFRIQYVDLHIYLGETYSSRHPLFKMSYVYLGETYSTNKGLFDHFIFFLLFSFQ